MSRVRVSLLAVLTLLLFTACSPPPEEPNGGGDRSVIAISAGSLHSLALIDNGDVWAWGDNASGQLGDGSTTDRSRPVKVQGLTDVVAVSAGIGHSLALDSSGTVWAWGRNTYGELGTGSTTSRHTPVQLGSLSNIVQVAAGGAHSLALDVNGDVWVWGWNGDGQLGVGGANAESTRLSPVKLNGLSNVISVSAGSFNSFALVHNEAEIEGGNGTVSVWGWGSNGGGEIGPGSVANVVQTPIEVIEGDFALVRPRVFHVVLLHADGTVSGWGTQGHCIGGGAGIRRTVEQIAGFTDVISLDTGTSHTVALREDGVITSIGINTYRQLGDGTTESTSSPVQAVGVPKATAVSAGANFTLALDEGGRVWAWGTNWKGQLGIGSTGGDSGPVRVTGLPGGAE